METTQMTPFSSSTFSTLPVCNIHFWIWKYLKFIFKFISSVHSGLQNTPIFCQKLLIRTAHHTFLESRYLEITKDLYYVLSTRQGQIPTFQCSWAISEVEENFLQSLCAFLLLSWWQKIACKSPFDLYLHPLLIFLKCWGKGFSVFLWKTGKGFVGNYCLQ